MTFIFEIAEADAPKLATLLSENAEYRPDYFGTLAATILRQWEQQRHKAAMAQVPSYMEECSQ